MGGAETSLVELLAALRASAPGWHLSLILGEHGPLAERVGQFGVDVHTVAMPDAVRRLGEEGAKSRLLAAAPALLQYAARLRRYVRATAPDFIHTTGFKMHVLGAWTKPRNCPLIWHVHDYVSLRPVMSRLIRGQQSACTGIIANSRSVEADLRAVCSDKVPIVTIYNAVDCARFSPAGDANDLDLLSRLEPPKAGTVRVGLVGTFARWKGHLTFLRALSLVRRDMPVRGYIIGGPLYSTPGSQHNLEELRFEASQLGISHDIGFTGFLENPALGIRALDIVVHASTRPEPFGMVIVEGMACGRAVVASRAGGALEIVREGENALAHEPGNADDLAHQIRILAADCALRKRVGAAGRADVQERFGRARLGRELMAFYAMLPRSTAGRKPQPGQSRINGAPLLPS
jgi:glycosyltransferase involved in cell wall biosynthesis